MNVGNFEIEQLSEGIFSIYEDGDYSKIDANHITDAANDVINTSYGDKIGIDPILIRDGKHNILLDTGLGWGLDYRSDYTDTSNLKTNLDIFGLSPEDITHVVLSHLHFDHSAGSTYVDEHARTKITMPYANYFVQKIEWYHALEEIQKPYQSNKANGYKLDEFYKIAAEEKLVLLTEERFELIPGVDIILTGGHTPGHQIVKISSNGETAYYLGDLVPTEEHLNHYGMRKLDFDPVQAKKAKTIILREAFKEEALLLFYHSIHAKAGTLKQDKDRRYLLNKS